VSISNVVVGLKFLLALTQSHDDLKHRVEHLESHLAEDSPEPLENLRCNVSLRNAVPPKDHRVYSQQFQAELVSLFREYGVETFEGMYGKE
jgi:hypothetical protein